MADAKPVAWRVRVPMDPTKGMWAGWTTDYYASHDEIPARDLPPIGEVTPLYEHPPTTGERPVKAQSAREEAKEARPPSDEEPWVVADDQGVRITFRSEDAAWRYRNEYTDRLTNPTVTHEPATTGTPSSPSAKAGSAE